MENHTGHDDFTEFVRQTRPGLRRAAYLMCWEWHETDDLVQDALMVVLRQWDVLKCPGTAGGYARRTMYRIYVDRHRLVRWQRETLQSDLPETAGPAVGQDHIPDRMMLHSALQELPPRQRAAVVLRFVEDLDVAQTAQLLGCEPATVRSQTTRALATMKVALTLPYSGDQWR